MLQSALKKLTTFLVALLLLPLFGVAGHDHDHAPSHFQFAENKGQWDERVMFRADVPYGNLFLEQTALTYFFEDQAQFDRMLYLFHGHGKEGKPEDYTIDGHCFRMEFTGANNNAALLGNHSTPDYLNYFLGNDESRWASHVKQYREVVYESIYPGIDFRLYSREDQLKYDLVLAPGSDPSVIQLTYNGIEEVALRHGELHIKTSVNTLIEQQPYAYQYIDGQKTEVPCVFDLKGSTVHFSFPEGYDQSRELVIDPVLVFASYSGSSKDNWGFTATYDNAGQLYAGGIVFDRFGGSSSGTYPTTLGAVQTTYGGGRFDMGITKFSSDGTQLVYSTFLGGTGVDAPHSLVVNNNQELVVLGSTSSPNYPTTLGVVDRFFSGGDTVDVLVSSLQYQGADIVVSRLNAAGSALLASTFIGGPENDGLNLATDLVRNYGDEFRGEVFVDGADNIYVASVTSSSTGFPLSNAVQNTFGGGDQDGCAMKLNSGLTTILWSTYLGGSGSDAAYSIQVDGSGNSLIAGGTNSADYQTTPGVLHQGARGGVDGFITKLNLPGDSILASTYIGTSSYDQNYFVQFDGGDSVYVVGQTEGFYPVAPAGVFSQPNGGQYVHKLNPDLDSTIFSMRFGTNRFSQVDIALSAFLVNDCDHIYVSGWGGTVNALVTPGSTTSGLTTTPGSHQPTTDGSDFYLIALAENADSIIYATFFGAGTLSEHVDGGTSRFDKKGIVYQAVCAGCGNSNAFPTTTGAWSQTNPGPNCNLGVIKFDMSKPFSDIQLTSPPYVCVPGTIRFGNQSRGTDFFWDFGDGNTSTDFEPVHTYNDTGTFEVMLVVSDSALCVTTDTSYVTIRGVPPPEAEIIAISSICEGDSVQLFGKGGTSRKWSPPYGLSNDTVASPMASPDTSTTYMLVVQDSCSSDTAYIFVEVHQDESYASNDTSVCLGNSIVLEAGGGVSYQWAPSASLDKSNLRTPTASPLFTTNYVVTIEDEHGCIWKDTVLVEVDPDIPEAKASLDTTICAGGSAQLSATGGLIYEWVPADDLNNATIPNPTASPNETTAYTVFVSNACGTVSDQVLVTVSRLELESVGDSIACIGQPARLIVTGADYYIWEPAEYLDRNDVENPRAVITEPVLFTIFASSSLGCKKDTTLLLGLRQPPFLEAGPDLIIEWGKSRLLEPLGEGDFYWQPPVGLSCDRCKTPMVKPERTTTYHLELTDQYGCKSIDSLTVYVSGAIYVPNAFTPNGDGRNDFFKAYATEIQQFELQIFNRWGEIVYESTNVNAQWDGTMDGEEAPIGAYVWQIKYTENAGKKGELKGLVNLIR